MDEPKYPNSLAEIMSEFGINDPELAKLVGTNKQQIFKLRKGQTDMSKEWAVKIGKELGIEWPRLMGWKGVGLGLPQKKETTSSPSLPEHTPDGDGVLEMDTLAGLGSGGEAGIESWTTPDDSIISAEQVKGVWGLPDDYLKGELGMTRKRARIIEVKGDSMEPTLHTSDRVMVDLLDRVPSPPGLFAFWDGWGTSVKRLEVIPRSEPPAFKAICDNRVHGEQTYTFEEANIIGRVVWVARKI